MATKKTGATSSRKTKALATVAQPLTPVVEQSLSPMLGSDRVTSKMPGTGGEITREADVTRVTGREYRTASGTVPAAEIFFDRSSRPREDGPWRGEADKVSWIDPATGYECIVIRDNPGGFLSGYVGVPEAHPLFGWEHQAIPEELGVEVHGGLTYSRICDDGPSPQVSLVTEARRICHVVVGYAPLKHATEHRAGQGQWWFGFDCDHVYDVVPNRRGDRKRFMGAETGAEYRNDGYVVREVRNLAAQLKAIADGRPAPPREDPPLPPIGLDPQRGGW